jgi:hypothetical protein
MTIVDQITRAEIAHQVQQTLDRYQPKAYRVIVDPDGIVEDDEWYHVVVKSSNDVRDRDFYDSIANAEYELNDKLDGHQFLLVPAIAD